MKIQFTTSESLGDEIVFTAAVESIKKQKPDWQIAMKSNKPPVWANNPHLSPATPDFFDYPVKYPAINESNQRCITYLQAMLEHVAKSLDTQLYLTTNRGHIYLTEDEMKKYADMKPYWIVIPSGKKDYTCKLWSQDYYQQVVNHFMGKVRFVQSVEKNGYGSGKLRNCVDYLVDIPIRDMFSLVYNAEGVVSHVTSWQHIAGAFQKPYVCIAGGREGAVWINSYPFQHTLHTVGSLPCCSHGGCWKARVQALNDNEKHDKNLCLKPMFYEGQWVPECLLKIKPRDVITTMERIL